jgi:hypothetical protein
MFYVVGKMALAEISLAICRSAQKGPKMLNWKLNLLSFFFPTWG